MAAHPDVAITVQGGGSFVGIQAARAGTAEIGMADLVDLPAEAAELTATVVARDGIAVVLHPSNGLADLTLDQVRDIFSGKIRNWSGVGGADKPITVVSHEAGSGTRSSFEQILKGLTMSSDALVQDSNGSVRETVANDPQAVGYLSHGLLNDRIKALTVNGQPCTTEAVIKGDYVLARPVFLLTRSAPEGAVKAFVDYILSPEGQKTIEDSGLIRAR